MRPPSPTTALAAAAGTALALGLVRLQRQRAAAAAASAKVKAQDVMRLSASGLPSGSTTLRLSAHVVRGFGRGSKELGIPTANLNMDEVGNLPPGFTSGIYYGWCSLSAHPGVVFEAIVSIGWNPFYKNKVPTVEVHIPKTFEDDFYGATLRLSLCGYVRPELDFASLVDLIKAINDDVVHAQQRLHSDTDLAQMRDEAFLKNVAAARPGG